MATLNVKGALSQEIADKIRFDYIRDNNPNLQKYATQYGVSVSTISNIIANKTYHSESWDMEKEKTKNELVELFTKSLSRVLDEQHRPNHASAKAVELDSKKLDLIKNDIKLSKKKIDISLISYKYGVDYSTVESLVKEMQDGLQKVDKTTFR